MMRRVGIVAVLVIAALLYLRGLDRAPIHLHYDEIFFGLEGYSIAQTGKDLNGRWLPLYVQLDNSFNWLQPAAVYGTALVLKVIPVSEAAIRLPTVLLGLLCILLMYYLALAVTSSEGLALTAAALLALTPAHFIHSRLAMDYLYPIPFVLLWLVCLIKYLRGGRTWLLFAATSCLGLGFFSYVAAVAMMPVYLAITLLVLLWQRAPARHHVTANAGFAWPLLLLLVPFLATHPELFTDLMNKYNLGQGAAGLQLDPFQRLRETINIRTVPERLNLFYDFFSPGFLFVSGGSNVTNSTRQAGVFLAPFAVLLPFGLYDVMTRPTTEKVLACAGFLTAPLAATIVVENYAIDRALALVPFGVLLAVLGISRVASTACSRPIRPLYVLAAVLLLGIGSAYALTVLFSQQRISGAALVMVGAGLAVAAVGYAVERPHGWGPLAAALLLMVPLQFSTFYMDYFGDYGARSAAWFGNNIRGAIAQVIQLDEQSSAPAIYLSEDIPHIGWYWRFYLLALDRSGLAEKAVVRDFESLQLDEVPGGSLFLTGVGESDSLARFESRRMRQVGTASDPNASDSLLGPGEHVSFVIHRVPPARHAVGN